ncbi:Phosphoglycolate phosphatase [Fundidesulfovibrio magnetotacticus]|uniref:phosphoglycolate phosphatase n=1 Tax=Fundidesulfovibrio magnetotacticus TaxID=2730080 RepID=A0A6V8LQI5_9BACT|nr:HAD-IA family hydrolase [Fundidesulfovibrio magnetotacticus]GFK93994.1 Phosphoglycolate phosphatase [Fundidesulfovibrio magnetotacticus]
MPRAVLFDLDGTLLDTLEDLADAGNATLAALGHPTHPVERYKQFVGDGVAMLVRRALPPGAGDEEFGRALSVMRGEYEARLAGKTRPYPGIPELLDALTARGVPMAVVSNKPDPFCQTTVCDYFGAWTWGAVLGETERFPRKPDPAGALHVASALGVAPADCLFLGDSPMDVRCALNAGMTPVGATWGFRERHTLEAEGGRLFIDRPEELLRFF